ncbi:MAG TPA: hypothetical protein VG603_15970, partial [Chitinophagales bacterium]|nr:hypothetical protein [Chitinophagales bacterium]
FKNGLDEIHGRRSYGTRVGAAKGTLLSLPNDKDPNARLHNKLSRVSKFIAGNYAIELTRRKNLQWSLDDFKYDNDNFIIGLSNTYTGIVSIAPGNVIIINNPLNISPGSTFTLRGAGANSNTYTITSTYYNPFASLSHNSLGIVYTGANTDIADNPFATHITVAESFVASYHGEATITFTNCKFPEVASAVLQSPVSGVIAPELTGNWLNMSLTPARMLQNNLSLITAGLQKIKGKVQFITGTGNFEAATQMYAAGKQEDYSGRRLSEMQSLDWNDPNARNVKPLWLPEIYRFQYPLTYRQFKQVLSNPHGYVQFYKFPTDVKQGFILSMDYQLKTGMANFELLKMYNPDADRLSLTETGGLLSTEVAHPMGG